MDVHKKTTFAFADIMDVLRVSLKAKSFDLRTFCPCVFSRQNLSFGKYRGSHINCYVPCETDESLGWRIPMNNKPRLHAYSRLLLIATACLAIGGCSTALITAGVLDRPAQEGMFSAVDRVGLEALAGKPIASRTNTDGKVVDLYSYVDGEAGVVGKSGRRPMSGERTTRAILTLVSAGVFEIALVPAALYERSEATREFYVVYTHDNRILAICPPGDAVNVAGREQSLCDSESAPVVLKDH